MSVLRITPSDQDRAEANAWTLHFRDLASNQFSDRDTEILAGIIAAVRAEERRSREELLILRGPRIPRAADL